MTSHVFSFTALLRLLCGFVGLGAFSCLPLRAIEIVRYNLASAAGNQTSSAGTSPLNITAVDLVRGAGLTAASGAGSMASSGWAGTNADDYFEFGFNVGAGYEVDLDRVYLGTRSSGTGPGTFGVYLSTDGFTTARATINQAPGSNFVHTVVDLSALAPVTGNIRIRLKAIGTTSAAGGTTAGGGTVRIANYIDPASSNDLGLLVTGTIQNAGGIDVNAPIAIAFTPADGAASVPVSATPTVTLSEPAAKGTGDILIRRSADNSIFATIAANSAQASVNGNQFILTPPTAFAPSTGYYVEIPAGAITDLAGNPYAGVSGPTAWNFTTLAAGVPPFVVKTPVSTFQAKIAGNTNPVHANFWAEGNAQSSSSFFIYSLASFTVGKGDFGLPASSTITAINSAQLTLTSHFQGFASGTQFELFLTTDPLIGNYGGKVFNPSFTNGIDPVAYAFTPVSLGRFAYNRSASSGTRTTFTLDLSATAGALLSRLNNGAEFSIALAVVNPTDVVTFAGVGHASAPAGPELRLTITEAVGPDTTAPTLVHRSPAAGAGAVNIFANLIAYFNEAVRKPASATGSVTVRRVSDGSVFESLAITDPRVSLASGVLTVDPVASLDSATSYYVEISAGALEDLAGNAFAGLAGPAGWSFTTAQPPISQTGPFTVSVNAPAGTVVGDLSPAVLGQEGIRYALLGGSGGNPMMKPVDGSGYAVSPVFTIGDTLAGTTGALNPSSAGAFSPLGAPDGLGAYSLNATTVRVFINHEVPLSANPALGGNAYTLANGTVIANGGARVTFLDLDKTSRRVIDGGLAIARIFDRAGNVVTSPAQLDLGGIERTCSSSLYEPALFGPGRGLVDRLYITGEESSTAFGHPHGGTFFALDPANGDFWALPDFGRGSWENAALVDTGTTTHVAFLLGDDASGSVSAVTGSALYLYVGQKSTAPGANFVERNGLKGGQLYAWKADNGDLTPQQFNATGELRAGTWVPINARVPALANTAGHDALGYKDDDVLHDEADALGCFSFARPEDLSTSPTDGSLVAFNATGRGSLFPASNWGATYLVDLDFANLGTAQPLTASILVLYSGADAGGGQFATPEEGLRSPDNLDWSDDGFLYIQENQANQTGAFEAAGEQVSLWRLDPATGAAVRVARIDRDTVLPLGSTDGAANDFGSWESSGIIDVSALFAEAAGTLFLFDVQAHSITNGLVAAKNLVEGGQICFLEKGLDRGAFALNPNTGAITLANPAALDPARPLHVLRVQAFDGVNHSFADVTVNITTTPVARSNSFKAATFNTSHYRDTDGALITDLTSLTNVNARKIARIIQRNNPDVMLLNEFDYDAQGRALRRFQENYLEVGQSGENPVYFPYAFFAPVNTGVPSGFDLDNNGTAVTTPGATNGYAEDCFGFGIHPGQYGFVVLSKFPIDTAKVRTFQKFLWKDMPGALLPDDPRVAGAGDWYSPAELEVYRLSSKTHADVPVIVNGTTVHVLASHPTPPVFDTPAESSRWIAGVDHNGRRNSDEIRFWSDYVNPANSTYIYDDQELAANNGVPPALGARTGGLPPNARFILFGDQNADKDEGDSTDPAIKQILGGVATVGGAVVPPNPLFNSTFVPGGGAGPSPDDTAAFSGGVRIDYVLPSVFGLQVDSGGVFWPAAGDPITSALDATDHHLVQLNLTLTGVELPPAVSILDYYAPAAGLVGAPLQAALHDIIDNQVVVDYDSLPAIMKVIDQDAANSAHVRLIYSNATLPKTAYNAANPALAWNREHVWPRNDGVGDEGPDFSDLHHLFPAQANVNSLRSSRRYDVVTGTRVTDPFAPESAADALDYLQDAASFEPLDRDKGVVARALLYMMTRYDGTEPLTTDLVLSNNPVFGGLDQGVRDTLLAWNRAFPPSAYEQARNQAIYSGVTVGATTYVQGNRNPFVDYPQFADAIYLGSTATSFAKWQLQRFTLAQLATAATSGASADPDGDGRNNWAEFLLNGDPFVANDTPLALTQAGNQVTITFHRPKGGLAPAAKVQTATSLDAGAFVEIVNWAASATVTDLGDYERVSYTATPNPAEPRRFWRVVFE